jgi:uncharacterized protein (UPF0332 family)
MSQSSNKVKWCLKKAETEIVQKGTHRGLVKSKEDVSLAEQHLRKARHNLKAAIYFSEGGYSDWSVSGFFYCIYHCFLAIARRFGYESRNQECTIALMDVLIEEGKMDISKNIVEALKTTTDLDMHEMNVINLRETFQYSVSIEFREQEKFDQLLELCKKALEESTNIVLE